MKHITLLQTFFSRFLIIFLNFGLVMFTTNFWGSEGKGIISILVANLAIIGFLGNIYTGGSSTYFASKFPKGQILAHAYLWSLLVGILAPLVFHLLYPQKYLNFLISLSVLMSLFNANISFLVGRQHIRKFNLYTILQTGLHILLLFIFVYLLKKTEITSYFVALMICYGVLIFSSSYDLLRNYKFSEFGFSRKVGLQMFNYGWKTQTSAFLQFLNYRLSFYFLQIFQGLASVGIYSVGVALAEAIWSVSRSLSIILYSDVVNSENPDNSIIRTKLSLKISFVITLFFIVFLLVFPAGLYVLIFGKDFHQTKEILMYLSPGILAIASSNIIGYYFAGINELRILNLKSIVGLVFTILGSLFFIPRYGIMGACIVTSVSYCLSSAILFWKFYQFTRFHVTDFWFSKSEIQLILNKIQNK